MEERPIKSVIAYIRVSTDNQAEDDKFGLDVQRDLIIAYCKQNNYEIIKWVSDEGESGAKYRKGFDEIVNGDITNPPYEAVVVAKSDRVARDINIYFYYQGALERKNIKLISISENFGEFGVYANALKSFVLVCAEMERRNIQSRTEGGRYKKASQGGYAGGRPPYGYRVVDGKFYVIPEEAEIVRTVFQLKETEHKTYREVCDYLNGQGKRNRSGTEFSISTIQVILGNKELYLGMYKYGKDAKWVKGVHEPILKEDN